ncbi:phosphotransferase [Nocardia puris]|uniref:phosphotransferase enzyme family protein n=1 Tax=Nocardia TaxID=1817 RepID=UPI0009DDFC38|nr:MULTISPECIES: phosphotransferase [Nocardia]MBF6137237.1 phosphotransferase [Nocardia otitidiscaviarum]MBF6181841.1 phosphotransferase [Nocardia otitidiscaviarum]MBF6461734.1 phosphotransferase [Nocardia puris]MBF6488134.1 phosphotransferase [Nocardia otitidiscaviarum]
MSSKISADSTGEVLRAACKHVGLDSSGAVVLNRSENVIYRLPGAVVVRIARPGQQAAAQREVQVARWLESVGMPAVRVVPEIDQPVVIDERAVTFWQELPPHRHGTPTEVAAALRKLHALTPPEDFDLGTLDPFVRLDKRIQSASTISADDRMWMREHLAELKMRWDQRPTGLPWSVVHGDAWGGNVVATEDGQVILLDLERTSTGPPEWDTVHTAIKYQTLGQISAEQYRAFCDVYGHDVTEWEGYELLRDLREFRMTTMAAQTAVRIPVDRAQADHRIACLRGKLGPRPWSGWRPVPGPMSGAATVDED